MTFGFWLRIDRVVIEDILKYILWGCCITGLTNIFLSLDLQWKHTNVTESIRIVTEHSEGKRKKLFPVSGFRNTIKNGRFC